MPLITVGALKGSEAKGDFPTFLTLSAPTRHPQEIQAKLLPSIYEHLVVQYREIDICSWSLSYGLVDEDSSA